MCRSQYRPSLRRAGRSCKSHAPCFTSLCRLHRLYRRVCKGRWAASEWRRFGKIAQESAMPATEARAERPKSEYVDFWNEVLVPKFIHWKHILVDGLTLHSAAVFPTLLVKPGDRVMDAGCGFGDTAIELARRAGPQGSVLGVDCCDAFLEFGRKDVKAAGIKNVTFLCEDVQSYPFKPVHD